MTHHSENESSNSTPTATNPDQGWHRLHPLSPLLRGGIALLVIAGILIANLRDRVLGLFIAEEYLEVIGPDETDFIDFLVEQRLIVVATLAALGLIALIVFFSWLSWRFHTYRISDKAVESRSGILFRQHRRAPLERIQSVNLQRPLLARAFGLTQVEVQTAGQGGEVSLKYLSSRTAKDVREHILQSAARRHGELTDQPIEQSADHSPETATIAANTRLSPALDQRMHDFIDMDVDAKARASGSIVTVPIGRLVGSILLSWETLIFAAVLLEILIAGIIWEVLFFAGVIVPVLIMLGVAYGAFNRGFNFTLSRTAVGVRVSAGLTALNTETIPLGRIHAVEVRQPLGWRPFGWWKVRITTAGHGANEDGQNKLQNSVLPVGHESDVLRVLETLLPGIADEAHEIERLRQGLHGRDNETGYLAAGRRAGWVLWFGKRRAGIRVEDADTEQATLRIRRGWLNRSFVVMPVLRAQSIQLHRPLTHRLLGLATLGADTVSGPVRMVMRGLELEDAQSAFAELAKTVTRVQGLEAERIRIAHTKK